MRYDKLVRGKVPQIIESRGEKAVVRIASEKEFAQKLGEKLVEEANEFLQSGNIEELADILEAARAICSLKKIDFKEIEKIREKKRRERGGFEKRIVLVETKRLP